MDLIKMTTANVERYEKQLKTQKEQEVFDGVQMLDHLSQTQNYLSEFDDESYRLHYENQEEFKESQSVMSSDDALVEYYQKKDPEKLKGLNSKSSINIVGKKSEKKKLRKTFMEAHSEVHMENAAARRFAEQKALEHKKEGVVYNDFDTLQEAKDALKEVETNEIMKYYENMGKSPQELSELREKVKGLSYLKRKQLKTVTDKGMLLDGDKYGMEEDLVQKAQEKYAKAHCPFATYEAYRIIRRSKEYDKSHPMPDGADESLAKSPYKHIRGFYQRTATVFVKEVNYEMKDGKQVPKTKEDAENLKYNKKFVDSIFSDKEEDIKFHHDELQKHLDEAWNYYSKDLKAFAEGKFDLETAEIDVQKLGEYSSRLLCLSGIDESDNSSLFKNKYAKSLPKAKQEENNARSDLLITFTRFLKIKYIKKGVDEDFNKYTFPSTPVDQYQTMYTETLKSVINQYRDYIK